MDSFLSNVERIAAAPFSLDAARRRTLLSADRRADLRPDEVDLLPLLHLAERAARRSPRLDLVAGSAVPEPTATQITDARDRFLARLAGHLPGARPHLIPVPAGQPSMALLRRIPRLLPWPDDDRPGA